MAMRVQVLRTASLSHFPPKGPPMFLQLFIMTVMATLVLLQVNLNIELWIYLKLGEWERQIEKILEDIEEMQALEKSK